MQEKAGAGAPRPLFVRVLEASAAAAGWDSGLENVLLEFEDGLLRRWTRLDQRNPPSDLGRYDESLRYELERLFASLGQPG